MPLRKHSPLLGKPSYLFAVTQFICLSSRKTPEQKTNISYITEKLEWERLRSLSATLIPIKGIVSRELHPLFGQENLNGPFKKAETVLQNLFHVCKNMREKLLTWRVRLAQSITRERQSFTLGLGTPFFSVRYVAFFSILKKERSILFHSFLEFLATYETQKNVPFFCKERKRTRERSVLFSRYI